MIWSRIIKPPSRNHGFTLVEMLIVLVLTAIVAGYFLTQTGNPEESSRYELSKSKLEALKTAIVGETKLTDAKSSRSSFGFVGDVGRLPSNLGELTTRGALPLWTFNTQFGVGAGWRGPYLTGGAGAPSAFVDGWGTAIAYSTTAGLGSMTSYGANRAAGGSGYDTDLLTEIPRALYLSTVRGTLTDATARQQSATVELRYPVGGTLTAASTTTAANGFYNFNAIPFGVRSIRVTGGRPLGPSVIAIDRPDFIVPDSALSYGRGAVTYMAGSAQLFNGGTRIRLQLNSTYVSTLQLDAMTFTSTAGGTYSYVSLNGTDQTLSPAVTSGTQADITATMTIGASAVGSVLEILTNKNQGGKTVTLDFVWVNRTETDSITISL